jgi:hypothetical protein
MSNESSTVATALWATAVVVLLGGYSVAVEAKARRKKVSVEAKARRQKVSVEAKARRQKEKAKVMRDKLKAGTFYSPIELVWLNRPKSFLRKSAIHIPDFLGDTPSLKLHLIPESDCRFSFGVYLQAIYGCTGKKKDQRFLRELANQTVDARPNFLRAKAVHGELIDTTPCLMIVPICDLDFIKNWNKEEGYDILVIAGGSTSVGGDVTAADAYRGLCKQP